MRKIYIGFALAVVLTLGTAPVVHAVTIADLQAQIQSLLALVSSLQQQISGSTSVTQTEPASTSIAQPWWCGAYADISYGARGTRVQALQQAMGQSVLGYQATGYYGGLTQNAWNRWCGTPIIGGDTDVHGCIGSAGYTWCSATNSCIRPWETSCPNISSMFSVYPTTGTAPLAAVFTAEGYANTWTDLSTGQTVSVADRGERYIDFGDGTGAVRLTCTNATASTCTTTVNHTYQSAGTYTATLFTAGYFGIPNDGTYGTRQDVASTTVTVTGGSAVGDPATNPQCKAWYDGCNNCSRSTPGGMALCTLRACIWKAPAYCTEYFGSTSTNQPPVISGFSGPTALSTNQTGTWTINASDPENGQLSYSVTWGDEYAYGSASALADSSLARFTQSATFTHSYSTAGTYTVRVAVRDAGGKVAETTMNVQVNSGSGNVACTMEYAPVCGQPQFYCAPGMYCTQVMPSPKTYGNTCMMNAENASLLYWGECQNSYYY